MMLCYQPLKLVEAFFNSIELPFRVCFNAQILDTFIPGAWIESETLWCEPTRLECIGDLLHEAGHLALTPSRFRFLWTRTEFDGDAVQSIPLLLRCGQENPLFRHLIDGDEQAAIAWSYAAAISIGLEPTTLHLHQHFDGQWKEIVNALKVKRHAGVNNLQHVKLTSRANFPQMVRWLQE